MSFLPYATGLIALGMLCLSSSHFAAVGLRTVRSRSRARGVRQGREAQLRRESQHARLASELSWQTATASPNAWRVLEVIEIVDESADCRSFYLRDPLGTPLPHFQPGQFIMVRPALGGARQPTRCYSLSDAPGQPWWRITVKRQKDLRSGRTQRDDESLSAWLHERIGVGDCLLASGPCGQFTLDDQLLSPMVLLAAGIGITPLVSMLKHALQRQPNRPVHVFFQAQDEEHWPLGEVLHNWQQECPTLSVITYFSRHSPWQPPKHGRVEQGKFNAAAVIKHINSDENAAYYLCGPEAWMETLIDGLASYGVRREQIHFESFGTSSNGQVSAIGPSHVEPWSLNFTRSGLLLESSSQSATIWEAASTNGLTLPAGCHSGACGSCRLRLLSGQVRYRTRPQCSLLEGEVLSCIAEPVGEVVVDA